MARNVDRRSNVIALNDAVQASNRSAGTAPEFGKFKRAPSRAILSLGSYYVLGQEGSSGYYRLPRPSGGDIGKVVAVRNIGTAATRVHVLSDMAVGKDSDTYHDVLATGRIVLFVADSTDRYGILGDSVDHASQQLGVTAFSGGGNTSAVSITSAFCQVSTSAAHLDSVALNDGIAGEITVRNDGANDVGVFPPIGLGAQIESLGADTVYPLASGSTQVFYRASATQWYTKNKGLRFVGRATGGSDYDEVAMSTRNNTEVSLDISAKLPPSAYGKPVYMNIRCVHSSYVQFSVSDGTNGFLRVVGSSGGVWNAGIIETTAAGAITYVISSAAGSQDIYILGWWVEG